MEALTPDYVQAALDRYNADIQLMHLDASTASSQEAAEAVGCELGQIAKSLCYLVDGEPVLVVASGDQRIDDRKLAALYDVSRKRVQMAPAEICLTVYGYLPGAVPPLGHRTEGIPVYLDTQLSRYNQLYAAAGATNAVFPCTLDQLLAFTAGKLVDLARNSDGTDK